MGSALGGNIQYLKGLGPKRAKAFHQLGINTIEGLLYYFPRRYEDRTKFLPIAKLEAGEMYTVKAQILAKSERRSFRRRGFSIIEVAIGDDTGKLFCVWFNQPYLKQYFKIGETLILYGKIEHYSGRLQMNSPEFEIVQEGLSPKGTVPPESLDIGRIVPIYTLPKGITQRHFRKILKLALDVYVSKVREILTFDIRSRHSLLNLAKSLLQIHFPTGPDAQKEAYRRLSFEEFFLFQIPLALRKSKKRELPGIAHKVEGCLVEDFIDNLPFKLTAAQAKVIAEIGTDMARPFAMQRLLQGDVATGKTVVATVAALMAIQGGYQAAFMAPTEILAKQHFEKIGSQVKKSEVKIGLLTSSLNKKEKDKIYQEIKEGKINLIIGTHALLEKKVECKNLGLVVIDEQHKFGVGQRALLPVKGPNPDVLIMTATPIPRTLAITLYADLDVSIINERPLGKAIVRTLYFCQEDIAEAYKVAKEQLHSGHQVYIIYPVIEESYALDIAGAKKMSEELKNGEFKDFRLALIHGRMKAKEQDEAMLKFRRRELDILVATTVIEVGIDIANATCMLIAHAERFGLSQLHQLRGRIGRGADESFCVLISDKEASPEAKARIAAMLNYNDGFKIAEEDLKIRGPGEFFGVRQSGLSELRIANPLTQLQLLKTAREEAIKLVRLDPGLTNRENLALKEKLLQRFPEYEKLMLVG
ncbi:MAG: ATP-dependent DNA helicase RecG [Candidatus Omnitrophota bacterium]